MQILNLKKKKAMASLKDRGTPGKGKFLMSQSQYHRLKKRPQPWMEEALNGVAKKDNWICRPKAIPAL